MRTTVKPNPADFVNLVMREENTREDMVRTLARLHRWRNSPNNTDQRAYSIRIGANGLVTIGLHLGRNCVTGNGTIWTDALEDANSGLERLCNVMGAAYESV